ncbi:MAG: GGDEF domain-containing protein [Halomonas sp.]|nr:GGDEF domain-containing protein [Halomonas sp.]
MKTIIQRAYRTAWRGIAGRKRSPSQRMHLAFLFFAALVGYVSAGFNLMLGLTSPVHGAVLVGFSSIVTWMWYRSRWRGETRRMAWWFCLLTLFVVLPVNWLFNQGMHGPTLMFFLMTAAYSLGVLPQRGGQRSLVLAGFICVPPLLVALDYFYPRWTAPYLERADQALDLGVSYLLNVAILLVMVNGHMARIRREQQRSASYATRLQALARLDSLTGLLNHGAFHAQAASRLDEVARGVPHVLFACDLDHFKQINDVYGHPYGDDVLRVFARLLREVAEASGGIAGRCGGEEFAVLLPGMDAEQARGFDHRLRGACISHVMPHGAIRYSSGLAPALPGESSTCWFERADRALYAAKLAGRNRLSMRSAPVLKE